MVIDISTKEFASGLTSLLVKKNLTSKTLQVQGCARWPLKPNFCPWATGKSQIFHTNHMLATLQFSLGHSLDVNFEPWFLYVFYSITFVLRNNDPTQHEGICSVADRKLKFMLNVAQFFTLICCVFWPPVRHYLQVFLGLYRTNREIEH